jgi:hypothetical protein
MTEERLYIKDIKKELPYRDRRSITRWCRNNDVRILSDAGSNKQFVLRYEFEKAKTKNYFVRLGVINSSMKFLSQNRTRRNDTVGGYNVKGEYEKEFLSIFTNL